MERRIQLKDAWQDKVRLLGDKIAQAAYDDGIIAPPYIDSVDDSDDVDDIELDIDIELDSSVDMELIESLVVSENIDIADIGRGETVLNNSNVGIENVNNSHVDVVGIV